MAPNFASIARCAFFRKCPDWERDPNESFNVHVERFEALSRLVPTSADLCRLMPSSSGNSSSFFVCFVPGASLPKPSELIAT